MASGTALQRYHQACEACREHTPADLDNAVTDAFDALTLPQRLRVILAVPWRDALHELRVAAGSR
jgi:hypothetical protein